MSRAATAPKFPLDPWQIREEGFSPGSLRENESVFSLGNGFIGLRGNLEEPVTGAKSIGGSYLNGVFESDPIVYGEGAFGYAKNSQTICNVADAKGMTLSFDGETLDLGKSSVQQHLRVLDMRSGILRRNFVWNTKSGCSLAVELKRLVSLTQPHSAAVCCRIRALSSGGELAIFSGIQPGAAIAGNPEDPRTACGKNNRMRTAGKGQEGSVSWVLQSTFHTGQCVVCAASHTLPHGACTTAGESADGIAHVIQMTLAAGQEIVLEKHIAYAWATEGQSETAVETAIARCKACKSEGFRSLAVQQEAYLSDFWGTVGMDIQGDDATLQGLRFNLFHLLQSTGKDGKTNIAAKGLTGDGYEGHYFWDTEIYVLPFFLYTNPQTARKLLEYRHSILDHARARARTMGHEKGALFPWRTINGEECSAYYPAGTAQYHINADIAYAVCSYVQATGDTAFLADYGAEILVETARLWYSLGFFNPHREGKFCIHCVTGPDEYNALVNNNVFTNLMAAKNMREAASALEWLEQNRAEQYDSLCKKMHLDSAEPMLWKTACDSMYVPYDADTGIYPQDDGFLERKPWPLDSIPQESFPLLLHYHPLVIYRHQVCKQADLVLAMLLLSDQFTAEQKKANFEFYDSITTHDSSLSKTVFSIIAGEIGERKKAYDYFSATARLDLDDLHGNTKDGLHMANMAGTWLCLVQGFGGMRIRDGRLSFSPHLPHQWDGYRFRIQYRKRTIEVSVDKKGTRLLLLSGDSLPVLLHGKEMLLSL